MRYKYKIISMCSGIALATSIAVGYVGFQLYLVRVAIEELGFALSDVGRHLD